MYNFLYIIYIKSGGRRGIDCFSKEKQSTSYHDVDDIMGDRLFFIYSESLEAKLSIYIFLTNSIFFFYFLYEV